MHEVAELAAPLVATARGIPCVDVSYGSLIPLALLRAAGEAAAPHWRARGLEPDPLAGLFRHLYVDTWPPSLQNPEIAHLAAVQALRPAAAETSIDEPPAWLDRLAGMPIVYLTMGTIWNRDLDVFRQVIEAVRDDAVALVVTVGRQNDPAVLGPQPDNVVVHQYVPQAALLGRCDAVITHGGAGTTLGALAYGLPLLVIPQGADQYANADGVVAAGAGCRLRRDEMTVPAIRQSVRALLADPDYRRAAERIAAEIRSMPTAASGDHADRSAARNRIRGVLIRAHEPVAAPRTARPASVLRTEGDLDRFEHARRAACHVDGRRRSTAERSRRRSAPRSRGTRRPPTLSPSSETGVPASPPAETAGSSGTWPSNGAPIASARRRPPPDAEQRVATRRART